MHPTHHPTSTVPHNPKKKKKNHETLKLLNIQMPFNENLCTNKHMTQAITHTLSNSFYVNKYYIIPYLVVPQ